MCYLIYSKELVEQMYVDCIVKLIMVGFWSVGRAQPVFRLDRLKLVVNQTSDQPRPPSTTGPVHTRQLHGAGPERGM